MSQYLFAIEMLKDGSSIAQVESWKELSSAIDNILKTNMRFSETQLRVASNILLLPAENALPVLLELSALANFHKCSYICYLLSDAVNICAKPKSSGMSYTNVTGL